MRSSRLLAALLFSGWSGAASAQDLLPAEAYGRLPHVTGAAVSPDGERIVLGIDEFDQSYVLVINSSDGAPVFSGAIPNADEIQLRDVGWFDDGRVMILVSRAYDPRDTLPDGVWMRGSPGRIEYSRYGVINLDDGSQIMLTLDEVNPWADFGAQLISPIESDPGFVRMLGASIAPDGPRRRVYRVNLSLGHAAMMDVRGEGRDTVGYLVDAQGDVGARLDYDDDTEEWSIHVYDDGQPRLLAEGVADEDEDQEVLSIAGYYADGRLAVLDYDGGGEFRSLYALNQNTGASELMAGRENAGVSGVVSDPWSRIVVGATWVTEDVEQEYFEPDLQAAYEAVRAAFGGGLSQLVSWSKDRDVFLAYAELGLDGGGYYVYRPSDGSVSLVLMRYPDVAQRPSGFRGAITYAAQDGAQVPAFLSLPETAQQNLPAVVLVHGGPHARDTLSYDWWAAFLTSRGYAVLQPNFRGSTGYGRSWQEAGYREWGGLMQTDVEDGVRALIDAGVADPDRICVVGASYGGYAALVGATLTPDLYQCAVSVAGVSDLEEMVRRRISAAGPNSSAAGYFRRTIGDLREDADRIEAVSPIHHADRVQIPILLIHGDDDSVVPINQSRDMRNRLRRANKDVEFVQLRGDDHWLSDASTRIQMLREIETFLGAHIGAP